MYEVYIIKELQKFLKKNPEMTVGQVIHSTITSRENLLEHPLGWLFSVSDEDFFTAMQNAIEKEEDE